MKKNSFLNHKNTALSSDRKTEINEPQDFKKTYSVPVLDKLLFNETSATITGTQSDGYAGITTITS